MPLSDHASRLEFLKSAASSLNALSPSTAAYLMTVHNGIIHDEGKPLNQRQKDAFCGACGSARNPEWTRTITVHKRKGKHSNSASRSAGADGATILKCLRCRRRTVKPTRKEAVRAAMPVKATPIPASMPDGQSAAGATTTMPLSDPVPAPAVNKAADNANSKKRAKARKQGGLQALMASKQQARTNSLDLFDFLQQ
ncbi:hypothetical protein BO70DRAFT_366126 [Aspergillus heteromorphus CBS 117.55]|uniref:Cullin binding protein CanA n=1 Tax=Aspergillus heteromorphus CBS 117.55 TaxID=1448321 RepID=A0A317V2Z3_9EURO|nr:uncharacterized protein BO70DRAFT_366126 [Aspergillus heteromorphus CBS 117.55]PWY68455.1 hypothetical protein BO70DRAFT_366126 [Aspergillus heteromorphus CBS 117.55]